MNTLLVALLAVGALSMFTLRREVFPEFELEVVVITVPYPGADPDEISESICEKIEESVSGIEYVKEMTSIAQVGLGSVVLELDADVPNVQKVLNEVRSEVDQVATFFPELAEDHEVKQLTLREAAIRVGVLAPDTKLGDDATERLEAELVLRELSEQVRDELVQLDAVSQANVQGAKAYQIDVQISEDMLRRYGLSLTQVATIIRDENVKLPGGTLKNPSQDVLLKGDNRRKVGEEIEELPLVSDPGGTVLTVGDLAVVKDGFVDTTSETYINGRRGMIISVDRTKDEDLLKMVAEVNKFVAGRSMPAGYELITMDDRSVDVEDRIELLVRNGLQGLLLVFIALAVFLELRLAFWVALGIPISIFGSCIILFYGDQTLNMLSLFAFLMGLGILVDDAIVVGENIYAHREMGKSYWQAAIDGTAEVFASVVAAISTTMIALAPMFFVSGVMGKFIAVLPLALMACLLISLFESLFILPCHLSHEAKKPWWGKIPPVLRYVLGAFVVLLIVEGSRRIFLGQDVGLLVQIIGTAVLLGLVYVVFALLGVLDFAFKLDKVVTPRADGALDSFISRVYEPMLRWMLFRPFTSVAGAITLLLGTCGFVAAGFTPFIIFPKLDSPIVQATVKFPDGTPADATRKATKLLEQSLFEVSQRYAVDGKEPVKVARRFVGYLIANDTTGQQSQSDGTHLGQVFVELIDTAERDVSSQELVTEWRKASPEIPGIDSLTFESPSFGPAAKSIEFKILADRSALESQAEVVEKIKEKLATYEGVFDVADDDQPGKAEFSVTVKPDALALGVSQAELTQSLRAAYFGEEVQRVQRGRHEVKIMVRQPTEDRKSLADFERVRVRTQDDGVQRPITELADIEIGRGPSEIQRLDQQRSITISADVDEAVGNAANIVADLRAEFMPGIYKEYPGISVRWKGQAEQQQESFESLLFGLLVALAIMYVLLTLEFKSYLQPAIIMAIVPFGIVGAIWGHAFMGLPVTLFSLFGIVALTGVVVNDSIVLIDFINHRISGGMKLEEALIEAGRRRFRPVMLTSLTTVCGLLPMLTERSFQAQILIPMAVSLSFGLMLATVLVVYLVPVIYLLYGKLVDVEHHRGIFSGDPDEEEVPASDKDLAAPIFAGSS
ncbi:efflux RND transporter permease subunit [Stratiformator vulcanicus]|nr:efflux RND transporter permease subunit [Stratiformator vulcanicus]